MRKKYKKYIKINQRIIITSQSHVFAEFEMYKYLII